MSTNQVDLERTSKGDGMNQKNQPDGIQLGGIVGVKVQLTLHSKQATQHSYESTVHRISLNSMLGNVSLVARQLSQRLLTVVPPAAA